MNGPIGCVLQYDLVKQKLPICTWMIETSNLKKLYYLSFLLIFYDKYDTQIDFCMHTNNFNTPNNKTPRTI